MGRASLTASITCWRSDKFTRDHLVFCKELAALQRRRQGLKDEVAMCDMEIERLEKLVEESRGKENTAVLAPSESEGAPLPLNLRGLLLPHHLNLRVLLLSRSLECCKCAHALAGLRHSSGEFSSA